MPKQLLFATMLVVISSAAFFCVGEVGARWWIRTYGNALDITRSIIQIDSELGWRGRANLDTSFLGIPLHTNELGWRAPPVLSLAGSEKRVLVAGPSSTFGWGVEQQDTYAAQLGVLLNAASPAQVINAGEIGYSSYQGVSLLKQPAVRALDPDVVIIAYGINDLDRNRFYFQSDRTDADEFAQPKSALSANISNLLFRSSLVSVLFKAMGYTLLSLSGGPSAVLDSEHPTPLVRVPLDDFRRNLSEMVHEVRSMGAQVVLLTTAVNLPLDTAAANKNTELYRQSALYAQKGDYKNAYSYYQQAVADEPYRIARDVGVYNSALKEVATQEKVPMGDIDTWFAGHSRAALFVDPIHFSPQGNKIIAQGLYGILADNGLLK